MKALTKAQYTGREGLYAKFNLEHGFDLRIGLLGEALGRVVMRRNGAYRLDRGWSVAPTGDVPFAGRNRDDATGFHPPAVDVAAEGNTVTIKAAHLRCVVTLEPFGIAWFRGKEREAFLADRPTQAYFASNANHGFAHFIARDGAERHYGLGDKAGPLDRTGRRFRVDAVDPCGYDAELSDPLYKMIPFYIVAGPRGAHGIFYDNMAVAEIDFGATLDNYHGLFRSYRASDGDLDYYVMAGPGMRDVVQGFSRLTGGHAFTPRWTLGFSLTSMAIADASDADKRMTDLIGQFRKHKIAIDNFHFGSGYSLHGQRRMVFEWNTKKFPNPEATLARLNAAQLHPVANIKPCMLEGHPRLAEVEALGGFVKDAKTGKPSLAQFWDGLGYHIDFTNPAARKWWRAGIERALLKPGMIAAWNDNNEFEIWDEDATAAGDGKPFPLSLARPAQPMLMMKLAHETQAAFHPDKRPYAITRAGGAGLWRYGQTWAGDNETAWKTLRFNLTQGLNMSLTGMFDIGHDVGGFHGPSPGPELLCRFVEFCAFWPRYVMNSWNSDEVTTLPWMHKKVLPQIRTVINLRYRLVPYLYTQMWRAAMEDVPVVRPLFFDFAHDPQATKVEDAFMLGPDLLVAPVLEQGETERHVYLPKHKLGWYDFHSGKHFAGGKVATVAAPLGRPPLFVRGGALLPLAKPMDRLDATRDTFRELVVYGKPAKAETVLYDDDGETAKWREGANRITRVTLNRGRVTIASEGTYKPAWKVLTVRGVKADKLKVGKITLK